MNILQVEKETLANTLQIIVWIVQIITFPLIVLQIWSLRRSIQSSTYQRVYELMIDIDKFFFEHKDFKPYIYPGAEAARPEVDKDQLLSTVEMMVDYFDNVYHQQSCMPRHTFEGFSDFMRRVYKNSEEIRTFIDKNRHWYPEKFIKHLEGEKSSCRVIIKPR